MDKDLASNKFIYRISDLQDLIVRRDVAFIGKRGGIPSLAQELYTDLKSGISKEENSSDVYAERIGFYGTNVIDPPPRATFIRLLWDALDDLILRILLGAALFSLIIAFSVPVHLLQPHERDDQRWLEGTSILVTVLVVMFVTALNNFQKDRQFQSLERVKNNFPVKVLRDGVEHLISKDDVLVGDIVILDTGDQVPADGIFISGYNLSVDESSMTGENESVRKDENSDIFLISGTRVTDGIGRMLVLVTGMHSECGKLMAKVSCEAPNTPLQDRLEKLAKLIGKFGLSTAILTFIALLIEWAIRISSIPWNWVYLIDWISFFISAVTIIVVAVPEGLSLAVTISLAYSMKQMLHDQNLVRRLAACETMGGATTICSDKTGTLTQNRMAVVQAWVFGHEIFNYPEINSNSNSIINIKPSQDGYFASCLNEKINGNLRDLLVQSMALNSKAVVNFNDNGDEYIGSKTECALLILCQQLGVNFEPLRQANPPVEIYPFSPIEKRMSIIVPKTSDSPIFPISLNVKPNQEIEVEIEEKVMRENESQSNIEMDSIQDFDEYPSFSSSSSSSSTPPSLIHPDFSKLPFRLFCKGASEVVLSRCDKVLLFDQIIYPINDQDRDRYLSIIDSLANQGLRTLVLAFRDLPHAQFDNVPDESLVLIAILAITDPLRAGVPQAIKVCQDAGIFVRMVTGDNVLTASSIARQCGILMPGGLTLDGPTFSKMSDAELDASLPQLQVLARAQPLDKLRLVQRLQALGEVVAVTGDGTNDAPALKLSNVGFAMGIMGTEVAKHAADIIIMDDNFVSIVHAVLWGRNVYDNIRKFLQFQLTVNFSALVISFISAASQKGMPLKTVQLLWVNLIMDTLAALALGTEKPNQSLLKRQPYGKDSPLISYIMWRNILCQGIFQVIILLLLLYFGPHWFSISDGHIIKEPSTHYTIIFNVFVLLQVFNQFNARSISSQMNVFSGLFKNFIFIAIFISILIVQIVLVQWGDGFTSTVSLSVTHWAICIAIGFSSILYGFLVRLIPVPKESYEKSLE